MWSSPYRAALFARSVLFAAVLVVSIPMLATGETSRATIEVEMVEFAFRPRSIRLEVGKPVRLVLRNRGLIAHQLEAGYLRQVNMRVLNDALHLEAPGLDVARLNPGGSAALEFLPRRKGRFAFACTIEGHREAGMTGVLDVRSSR